MIQGSKVGAVDQIMSLFEVSGQAKESPYAITAGIKKYACPPGRYTASSLP
jgi:hypothetical protein